MIKKRIEDINKKNAKFDFLLTIVRKKLQSQAKKIEKKTVDYMYVKAGVTLPVVLAKKPTEKVRRL